MGAREDDGPAAPAGLMTGRLRAGVSAPRCPNTALLADGERGVAVGPRGDFVRMRAALAFRRGVFHADRRQACTP
jgi:hypothetical protein